MLTCKTLNPPMANAPPRKTCSRNDVVLLGSATTAIVSGRLSHFFNSNGPSMTIDTAVARLWWLLTWCSIHQHGSGAKEHVGGVNLMLGGKRVFDNEPMAKC
uniref:Beta-ketoacyl synthase N-terminal domain-containing protein n=1 Tax=Ditylenchus dipsaci TaxID=166011 RepID=A0A915DUR8_9BILA